MLLPLAFWQQPVAAAAISDPKRHGGSKPPLNLHVCKSPGTTEVAGLQQFGYSVHAMLNFNEDGAKPFVSDP